MDIDRTGNAPRARAHPPAAAAPGTPPATWRETGPATGSPPAMGSAAVGPGAVAALRGDLARLVADLAAMHPLGGPQSVLRLIRRTLRQAGDLVDILDRILARQGGAGRGGDRGPTVGAHPAARTGLPPAMRPSDPDAAELLAQELGRLAARAAAFQGVDPALPGLGLVVSALRGAAGRAAVIAAQAPRA